MKKHFLLFSALILVASWLQAQVIVNSDITGSTTWTSNNIYQLEGGCIYLRNNATLTIEPGTIVKGNAAALIVLPGSQLIADGTKERPIVFTSSKAAGQRAPGDWGGIVLLGKAPINVPGGTAIVEGGCVDAVYGGTDAADNSGILRYVRIEFAGIPFQPNNELNSLTLGGVGSGTVIENVQTSYGGDDAFEWFGGVVNGKWLIAYRTVDDMFDTDFGYQGKNQWVLGVSDPNLADVSGSNGFESDNDASGSTNSPRTDAKFSNVTIFGPKQTPSTSINSNYRRSGHLRRSTLQDIFNSVFTGFPTGLRLESANSENAFLSSGELKLKNNVYAGVDKALDSTSTNYQAVLAKMQAENTVLPAVTDLQLTDPANLTNPNFQPAAGSPLLTGADFTSPELTDAFFTATTYRGAFGDTDWSDCWAEWDPINADYSTVPLVYISKPTVTAGGATTFCQGSSVTLSAPAGFNYAWSNGATTQDISVNASGSYIVTISNNRGCAMSSDAVAVTVNPTPTANFNFNVDGSTVIFSNVSTGANTYLWEFGDGTTATTVAPTVSHTYSAAGSYTVCLTANTTAGCSNEVCKTVDGVQTAAQIIVDADISSNTTWTNNNIYVVQGGCLYVRNNSTLTIEPGTVVRGNAAALIVLPGSKLIADGTKERPIVFTSNKPAGQRTPGDWGGIVLLGKAPINVPGGTATVEGGCVDAIYGGTDAADNSGILRYVRIEFAGIPFQPNNELNSLTLGGVGTGTVIEYVQTSYGGDDAFEWFGGTVNGKWLIAYRTVDDMFDTDFGYNGKNQWVLGVSDPNIADVSGSNGFESDNDASGSTNTPTTDAKFSNVSILGPKQTPNTPINTNYRRSTHIRRSSLQDIFNSVFTGFPTGLRLESSNSENAFLTSGELKLKNNVYAGMEKILDSTSVNFQAVKTKLEAENTVLATVAAAQVTDPFNATNPNFLPQAGSPLLSGASFTSPELTNAFFTPTTYRGAFGDTDWSDCWAEWDPINADYSKSVNYSLTPGILVNAPQNQLSVDFTGTTPGAVSYYWEFGDGETSAEENPSHTYDAFAPYTVTLTVSNSRGCTATASTTVDVTTGVNELEGLHSLKVFPNPFSHNTTVAFSLENAMEMDIRLLDVTGKVVRSQQQQFVAGANSFFVNGDNLNAGVYFLRLLSAEGEKTVRVSVVK